MFFEQVLESVKNRSKIARKGWNGKNMYVTKIPAGNAMYQGYDMQDCLGLKTASGVMQPGWVPSQDDIFANDWEVLE